MPGGSPDRSRAVLDPALIDRILAVLGLLLGVLLLSLALWFLG
jgi:hypothetical protein